MHFINTSKGFWTLTLLAALSIGSSSCTAAKKKVNVSPSKPAVQLEYRVGESFVKNKPFAEIKEFGNPQSDKIVYYIPQVHETDTVSTNIENYFNKFSINFLLDCQDDIYKVIEDLNRNHGVGLLALEGAAGRVDYKGIFKKARKQFVEMQEKNPDMTKEEINHNIQKHYDFAAGLKYELMAKDDILTIGVEDIELHKKTINILKGLDKILNQFYDLSKERSVGYYETLKNKYLRNLERFEAYGVKGRSDTAVSKLLESMHKHNMNSSILIYGGAHTDTIIDAFGDKVKLYVIELNSYRIESDSEDRNQRYENALNILDRFLNEYIYKK